MRTLLAILTTAVMISQPARGAENQAREFVMSCTYGVLAGTLVGAASLAFTSKPSDNFGRVARGASLGLYTGILLGLYVVYVVPGLEENAEEEQVGRLEDKIPFMIAPTFGKNFSQLDGVQGEWTVLRF